MYTSIVQFFQNGGVFMYPIMVVLAIGFTIAIERYIYLSLSKRQNHKLLKELLPLLQRGDYQLAYGITSKSNLAIGRILSQGLTQYKSATHRDDIEAAMKESMMEIIPHLKKHTHYLTTFATIATLLGLLGTIIDLSKVFTTVAQVDPAMQTAILANGISAAMNTTVFGLMVTIPLLLSFVILQTKTNEIVDSLETAVVKFVNLMMQRKTPGK